MHLKIEGGGHHFIAEISLPKPFVFNHVSIALAVGKVYVEILHLFGNLFL
jgi:hypothetical protein